MNCPKCGKCIDENVRWCDDCKLWLDLANDPPKEHTPITPRRLILTVISIVFGMAAGWAFGFMLVYPLVPAAIFWSVSCRLCRNESRKAILPALSVQFGQWSWFFASLIALRSFWPSGPDILLLGLLLLLLFLIPSVATISVLLLYQAVSLGLNVLMLATPQNPLWQKAVLLQCCIRLAAIAFLVWGMWRLDRVRAAQKEAGSGERGESPS